MYSTGLLVPGRGGHYFFPWQSTSADIEGFLPGSTECPFPRVKRPAQPQRRTALIKGFPKQMGEGEVKPWCKPALGRGSQRDTLVDEVDDGVRTKCVCVDYE